MPIQYLDMTGEDFVERVLLREEDFNRVRLPPGCDLTKVERYQEMHDYLIVRINNGGFNFQMAYAQFEGVKVPKIYLRYINGENSNFRKADLTSADFTGAILTSADFENADLSYAQFAHTNLVNTILRGTKLWNTDLHGANLTEADLRRADILGANLKDTILTRANFIYIKGIGSTYNFGTGCILGVVIDPKNYKKLELLQRYDPKGIVLTLEQKEGIIIKDEEERKFGEETLPKTEDLDQGLQERYKKIQEESKRQQSDLEKRLKEAEKRLSTTEEELKQYKSRFNLQGAIEQERSQQKSLFEEDVKPRFDNLELD